MLDNNCNTASLDGCSVPRSGENNHLSASCICGHTIDVDLTRLSHTRCICGLPAAEGILAGPHRHHLMPPPKKMDDSNNVVYFAQVAGLVKIGTTGNLRQRLKSLGEPTLLGFHPGGYAKEKEVHRRFGAARIHGEVFELTDEIRHYIARNCTAQLEPMPSRPARPNRKVSLDSIARQRALLQ